METDATFSCGIKNSYRIQWKYTHQYLIREHLSYLCQSEITLFRFSETCASELIMCYPSLLMFIIKNMQWYSFCHYGNCWCHASMLPFGMTYLLLPARYSGMVLHNPVTRKHLQHVIALQIEVDSADSTSIC